LHFEPPFEDVDRLLLRVMDVQRRPTVRRDLDREVVEGPAGVLARHESDRAGSP
jgi:hypothetical protein